MIIVLFAVLLITLLINHVATKEKKDKSKMNPIKNVEKNNKKIQRAKENICNAHLQDITGDEFIKLVSKQIDNLFRKLNNGQIKTFNVDIDKEMQTLILDAGNKRTDRVGVMPRATTSLTEIELESLRDGIDDLLFKSESQGVRYFTLIGLKVKGYLKGKG